MPQNRLLIQGYLAAAATLVMWTGLSLVSRMGGKSVLTGYDVYALRLLTASIVLLPFAGSLPAGAWRDRRLWTLAALGSLIYCILVYHGFKCAPAAHGAILLSGMQPFLISAVVWLIVGTRPGRLRSIGLILIGSGLVCAALPYFHDWSTETLFGDLLILLGSTSWAVYGVLATRWGYSPWILTRAVAFGPAFIYLPIYFLWLPKQIEAAPLSAILLQCIFQGIVATILAMLAYLKAISILGPERAAAFLALVPITTGILAMPLLDETLTVWLMSGLILVSLGSYIASRYGNATLRS